MATFKIEPVVRPCWVTVRDYEVEHCRIVNTTETRVKALFHFWNNRSEVVAPSPLKGGHPGGVISDVFAIVEFEDGTIHEARTTDIQFCDSNFNEYCFGDEK